MKYPSLLTLILLFSIGANAQNNDKCFTYDNAGNRISVSLCVKSMDSNPDNSESVADLATEEGLQKSIGTTDEWFVYPNPSEGILNIDIREKQVGDIQMMVFDLNGKKMMDDRLSGSGVHQVNISFLTSGEYILDVFTADDKRSWSIIKK